VCFNDRQYYSFFLLSFKLPLITLFLTPIDQKPSEVDGNLIKKKLKTSFIKKNLNFTA